MSLGGYFVVHNGIELDYCFQAALASLLDLCDQVVVLDAESTDGTTDYLHLKAKSNYRLKVISAPWRPARINEATKTDWLYDLHNEARRALTTSHQVLCQADEVFHPDDFGEIHSLAKSGCQAYVDRLNFWVDSQHYVPEGKVCGKRIIRIGRVHTPVAWAHENLQPNHPVGSGVRLFHYGFLRNGEAFCKKSEVMEKNLIGEWNPMCQRTKTEGTKIFAEAIPLSDCHEFHGTHPHYIIPWLKSHGFNP